MYVIIGMVTRETSIRRAGRQYDEFDNGINRQFL